MADPIPPAELDELRSHVGSQPDEQTLQFAYDRLGHILLVAIEVLRRRRADIVATPTSWSGGEYSENWQGTVAALDADIARLQQQAVAAGVITDPALVDDVGLLDGMSNPGRIVRPDRERLFGVR